MDPQRSRLLLVAEAERLHEVRAGLERDRPHESDADRSSELSSVDQHQADVASEVFQHEVELSILAAVDAGLSEVVDALHRLDRGHFGVCQLCEVPIPDDRLEAMPATRFCFTHEQLQEGPGLTQAIPAGPYRDGAAFAGDIAAREAGHHLDLLPADDEMDEDLHLGPEELALHRIASGDEPYEPLTPEDVERAELMAFELDRPAE
jgi:RNA polymerase-binding transcription factor DksA